MVFSLNKDFYGRQKVITLAFADIKAKGGFFWLHFEGYCAIFGLLHLNVANFLEIPGNLFF
jgi:hypothetical protein